jgi:hypothetical protein
MESAMPVLDAMTPEIPIPPGSPVVLRFAETEVEIRERNGAIEMRAECDIRIRSGGRVEIRGDQGVTMSTGETHLALDPRSVRARAEEATFTWGKLHQVVGRLFDWAGSVYRRVDGVLHTRAGRVRTQAQKGYLLQAREARIHARKDVRVQGRQIHLG